MIKADLNKNECEIFYFSMILIRFSILELGDLIFELLTDITKWEIISKIISSALLSGT